MLTSLAKRVAEDCTDAYSCDNYTPAGWRQCGAMLAKRGFSLSAIEEILRSKWTRWACDGCEVKAHWRDGVGHTSKCLARFLDGGKTPITPSNWAKEMNR